MPPRNEEADVKAILETNLKLSQITPFLEDADVMVTNLLEGKQYTDPTGTVVTISAATLKAIERWIAAHFASMWDKRVAESDVEPSSFTFEGETGKRLDFTRYGQQAINLDPTGCLRKLGDAEVVTDRPKFVAAVSSDRNYPPGQLPPPVQSSG